MPDMPAVFQQSSSPPKLDLASAHSQVFQVPATASASSSLYSLSVSRKRPRRDTEKLSSKFEASPEVANNASPLIHSDYRQTSAADDLHTSAEVDYRPNRYRECFGPPPLNGSVDSLVANTHGASRKRSRRDSIASPTADGASPASTRLRVGWGRSVINAVGKVLDLCWSGAIRGFHAGGGQGYNMNADPSTEFNLNRYAGPATSVEKPRVPSTRVPGQYPQEDIDQSWVVIPSEPADPFTGSNDGAGSPSVRARRIHQVSSPRRRPAVMPRLGKRAAPSTTPIKSPGLPSPRSKDGPGSAEVQKYAAQIRRKEREEGASIRRLNRQLQAMIREGKEALGTTVEVDDLQMDCDYD